jgi:hypothetical protein
VEIIEQEVKISNRFAAFEILDDNVYISKIWKHIRENLKTSAIWSLGYYEFKQHKPWFYENGVGQLSLDRNLPCSCFISDGM